MPYFDPQPTAGEITSWIFPNGDPAKVPGWPRPNSNRIDPHFRLLFGSPKDAFTASRYLFSYVRDNPGGGGGGGPPITRWGWFDLDLIPGDFLGATLPTDTDGLDLEISFFSVAAMTFRPIPGVEIQAVAQGSGPGSAQMTYQWSLAGPRPWRFNVQMDTYAPDFTKEDHFASWQWFINEFTCYGVTDCYQFLRAP